MLAVVPLQSGGVLMRSLRAFGRDDAAVAPFVWLMGLGAATVAVGWSARQVGNGAEGVAHLADASLLLAAGGTVMALGAFLIGVSAWKSTVRFVPLGIVLMFIGLPLLGFDFAALQAAFGGGA